MASSPDLKVMDYSILSILEARACTKPYANVESLKSSITKEWNPISEETVHASCHRFDFVLRLS